MRYAQVYIRNQKNPIEVTEEEGLRLQRAKNREGEYANSRDRDPEHVGNIWHGELGHINYIMFKEMANPQGTGVVYSEKEKQEFRDEIERYCVREGNEEYEEWIIS